MSDRRAGAPRAPLVQLSLFNGGQAQESPVTAPSDPDAEARAFAADPRFNVVLEASAGTGKTSVLVARYVNLLKAGIDPSNILAITFTRKAAAEMRERIVGELRAAAARSEFDRARWLELRDRLSDIAISTIDAFCLSMLREFPLEADVDPAFDLADETEVPRLVATALDRSLRILTGMARTDKDIALVLAQLGIARTREGLATLIDRRLVAWDALDRFLARGPRELTADSVCQAAAASLREALQAVPGGLSRFLADGPSAHPRFELFRREVQQLDRLRDAPEATVRAALERVTSHFLTNEGTARKPGTQVYPYKGEHYPSRDASRRHRDALFQLAPQIERLAFAFNRDLNVVMARGVRRMFGVALAQYRQALEERSVLDFSDVLERARDLLRRMDEFSQSRYRLESRYHHVLVDEFQDTSRAQWELVSLLVRAWGEGAGLATSPSVFIVGDRKQSIYRFRDAEVAVLQDAAEFIEGLRPGTRARRSIARSFRAVPELLQFVNDLFAEIARPPTRADDFTYDEPDRFPVTLAAAPPIRGPVLGLAAGSSPEECAAAVADEIVRLLEDGTVRDKSTGVPRRVRPGDIAILFRSRSSHREFERELGARGVPTYVYKGLGFFDADEIKDLSALVRYLADPWSPLRAAALLRSRFVRLSDRGLAALAPDLAEVLLAPEPPESVALLDDEDRRVVAHARAHVPRWLHEVDRLPPAELVDGIIERTAYAFELAGARRRQAWENVKKMRGLVRRIQNRGYATIPRIAEYLKALTAGDESNAVVEAIDAVNLMTVHASKGLEFPVVFLVNLARGASGPPRPIRVVAGVSSGESADAESVTVGSFLSETDEAERERERHETRRLLYVAVTRARDRLYLASTLKDGVHVPGRGSLAEVLPDSINVLFSRAAAVFDELDTVGWAGTSGHEYAWRLCRPSAVPLLVNPSAAEDRDQSANAPRALDDFDAPSPAGSRPRVPATQSDDGDERQAGFGAARSDRVLGSMIHRLFERAAQFGEEPDPIAAADFARLVLRPDERVSVEDPEALVHAASSAWMKARRRPDVVAALDGAERFHEVPFSLLTGDGDTVQIVRGTIDCLVRKGDGRFMVVEFKTGRPHTEHDRQLAMYVRAAQALYPDAPVDGVLIYL